MKLSLRSTLCALVLPSILLIGCGNDDNGGLDMSLGNLDMPAGTDMPPKSCTTVATWPSDMLFGRGTNDTMIEGYDFITKVYADRASGLLTDTLRVEVYHPVDDTATIPRTVTIPADGTFNTCNDCVLIDLGQNLATEDPGTLYFARGGSITITKADRDPVMGSIAVSGSNVHFVEWLFDDNNDKPVNNGKCIDVGSFNFSTTYDNNVPDGGTTD